MAAAVAATARFVRSPRAPTRLQFDLQLGQQTLWLVVVLGVRPFREGEDRWSTGWYGQTHWLVVVWADGQRACYVPHAARSGPRDHLGRSVLACSASGSCASSRPLGLVECFCACWIG